MKYEVICFISHSGPNVNPQNLEDTLISISKNINTNFSFFINTDNDNNKDIIQKIITTNKLDEYLLELEVKKDSWSICFNDFFEKYKNLSNYILMSHDDVYVRTFDFFNITLKEIEGFEDEIGWIGFTSDNHYTKMNVQVCQSAREIFCKDRLSWPKTFELHKMTDVFDEKLLDYPKRACKVPGIFSHFNLIKNTNLEKIGPCKNWGKYTLLIDEDWSLRTLIKNMWTVWVPNVFYDHPLRYEERKILSVISENVESQFYQEWGYSYQNKLTDDVVNKVCEKFPNTNISFFNDFCSYEYQYLK
jgi:hypothetical protein